MSIRFRGGERLQRGRGIGGLLRLVKSVFSPIVKSIGRKAVQVVTSKAGKRALKAIKDQAITSAGNMTADVIKGNDLSESAHRELSNMRQVTGNSIQEVTNMKPKNKPKKTVLRKNVSKPILSKRDRIKYGDKKHQNQFL